jgi:hypothetical protein
MTRNSDQDVSKKHRLAVGDRLNSNDFPLLYNLSSAFFYQLMPRPAHTGCPEFIYLHAEKMNRDEFMDIFDWNFRWEAGHLRQHMFREEQSARGRRKKARVRCPNMVELLKKVNIPEDSNIYFLPFHTRHRYHSYASLFHRIPAKTLKYNGLPCLAKGLWPVGWFIERLDDLLPCDFDDRFAQAFSFHIWPLINSGSKTYAFSKSDPLKMLSHNLDFWLPRIFKVVENRLNQFERVEIETEDQLNKIEHARLFLPAGVEPVRPLKGGSVWEGEEDAWEATKEMVELADSDGKLRGMIDAIRSNRVEEDFSDIWSNAREDFERKLYRKRSKMKITFVELTETLPVHGPDSEFHENLLWEDFFGILDQKERRIVVCLRNGITKLGDIANEIGYANHSPISKALKKIREKATKFLND